MVPVKSFMVPKDKFITVERDVDVRTAGRIMRDRNIGSLFVTNGKEVIGIITDTDMVRRVVATASLLLVTKPHNDHVFTGSSTRGRSGTTIDLASDMLHDGLRQRGNGVLSGHHLHGQSRFTSGVGGDGTDACDGGRPDQPQQLFLRRKQLHEIPHRRRAGK